ncbi:MAG: hypothetical protein OSJ71_01470 [Acetatifactor sp.]|nr:hypothetical protein [Acetatifactor sp.]
MALSDWRHSDICFSAARVQTKQKSCLSQGRQTKQEPALSRGEQAKQKSCLSQGRQTEQEPALSRVEQGEEYGGSIFGFCQGI